MLKNSPFTKTVENYRPDIDGLRAIAVLSVLFYHAFPGMLPGGFIGVDVFFVISGYLITGLILRQLDNQSFSLADFYLHRCRRIFPALVLILGCSLLFGWFVLLQDEFEVIAKHVWGGGFFVSNFVLWKETGYFDTNAELKPLLHLWSLSVEEQFYLFWPLSIVIFRKFRKSLLGVTGLLFLCSFICNLLLMAHQPEADFYLLPGRLWELELGALLVILERYHVDQLLNLRDAVVRKFSPFLIFSSFQSFWGLVLLLAGLFFIDRDKDFPGWWALLPTVGAFLVISSGPLARINKVLLSNRVAVFVGLISYPLYLWHWPILSFWKIVAGRELQTSETWIALGSAFLLAVATYLFLERPIRLKMAQMKERNRGGLIAAFSAPMLICSLLAGMIYDGKLIHSRDVSQWVGENLEQLKWIERDPDCVRAVGLGDIQRGEIFCNVNGKFKDPSVAIIGDCTANQLFPGFSEIYEKKGQGVINIGMGTCIGFNGIHYLDEECEKTNEKIYRYILETPSIKTVIFGIAPWDVKNYIYEGRNFGGDVQKRMTAMAEIVRRDLHTLESAGKKIVVTFDNPFTALDPHSCLRPVHQFTECRVDKASVMSRMEPYLSFWRQLFSEDPRVCVFNQGPLFSDGDDFLVMRNHLLLYRDDHRLSFSGSEYVGNEFAKSECF